MSKQSRDRIWFTIHSWVGLKLSLLMTFILVTGTIAVFSYEIDWLLNKEMRASELVSDKEVAWGAAYDTIKREYPGMSLISINRFQDPWFSLEAFVVTPWRENAKLWLEPVDGTYLGAGDFYNVQRFFRSTHRHLMMPNNIGIPIVTFLAFPLLISLIAGFVVYKKFWRGFFKMPRFERKTRIWMGDVHRLVGLWTSWFVALIALTSVWYFVEELGGRSPPFPAPGEEVTERNRTIPANFDGDALDLAIARALEHMPGLQIRRILFPANENGAITIQGDHTALLVRARANSVYIDPATREVIGSYRGEDLDLHTRISEASDPLHFGYFGGFLTKVIWFILGALMSSLAITGVVIYTKRLRKIADDPEPRLNLEKAKPHHG